MTQGYAKPRAWMIRTPAQQQRPELKLELLTDDEVDDREKWLDYVGASEEDGACNGCGLHICNCERAPKAEPAADALPEGWRHEPTDGYAEGYKHVSGADVFRRIGGNRGWMVSGCPGSEFATRAEAMAAALGFTIDGDAQHGYCYLRDDFPRDHEQTVMANAESAALAALAFDADQRRKQAPERDPNELPPGWRRAASVEYPQSFERVDDDAHVFYAPTLGGWLVHRNADGTWPDACQGAIATIHEAMRIARGLNTIEELWR